MVASLLLLSALPTTTASAPMNDLIGDATLVHSDASAFTQSTAGASLEAGEPRGHPRIGATVWYVIEAPGTHLTADSRGSNFDTLLCAYVEHADGTLALATSCSDDHPGAGVASRLDLDTTPGRRYFVQAGGYKEATGTLQLQFWGAQAQEMPRLATIDPPILIHTDGNECWRVAPVETSCTTGTHVAGPLIMDIWFGDYNGRIESTATWGDGLSRTLSCDVTTTPEFRDVVCEGDESHPLAGVPFTHTCRSLDLVTREPGGSGEFACSVR